MLKNKIKSLSTLVLITALFVAGGVIKINPVKADPLPTPLTTPLSDPSELTCGGTPFGPKIFCMEVTVKAGESFSLPASGGNVGKTINWKVNWGDQSTGVASGTSNTATPPIFTHSYVAAGTYLITLSPNGLTAAWLAGFGFYDNTTNANALDNKAKLTKVISPIFPQMTRTAVQISNPASNIVDYEWNQTFLGAINLAMGEKFTFDQTAWAGITAVGTNFASSMFNRVSGPNFNMSPVFNLPQNIKTCTDNFASSIFREITSTKFTMNAVFNTPQAMTTVRDSFFSNSFLNNKAPNFNMNDIFTFPQNITAAGNWFARGTFNFIGSTAFNMNDVITLPQAMLTAGNYFGQDMFRDIRASNFTMGKNFNLPQKLTKVGIEFIMQMFEKVDGGSFNMNAIFNFPPELTTVGHVFGENLFRGLKSEVFNMNAVFNLPPKLTTVPDNFADGLFYMTKSPVLNMNSVFNLPQGIITSGELFACNMLKGIVSNVFTLNNIFNFPPNMTSTGREFAAYTFRDIQSPVFNMNQVINIPQGITSAMNRFGYGMFMGVRSEVFTMNNVFTLPPGITTVDYSFGFLMFDGLTSPVFTMGNAFNLPQNIASTGVGFARSMFQSVKSAAFQVNSVFKFPKFAEADLQKDFMFLRTLQLDVNCPPQNRTISSILNGNSVSADVENSNLGRLSFGPTEAWSDIVSAQKWFGGIQTFNDNSCAGDAFGENRFCFYVEVKTGSLGFTVPTPGGSHTSGLTYNWNIRWGDGTADSTNQSGTSSSPNAGISHNYTAPGVYLITITPNGANTNNGWLAAFGFTGNLSTGSGPTQTNREKIIRLISPIYPAMTRTALQIANPSQNPAPAGEWDETFIYTHNIMMGSKFTFAGWDGITKAGNYFANSMFYGVKNAAFNMNKVFNLPQDFTSVGDNFAGYTFKQLQSEHFRMNSVFNLPQNITDVGTAFAAETFAEIKNGNLQDANVSGRTFAMNDVFNLPQKITTVKDNFAKNLFNAVDSTVFRVNNVFKLPLLSDADLRKTGVYSQTLLHANPDNLQTRLAGTIINGNKIDPDVAAIGSGRNVFNIEHEYKVWSTLHREQRWFRGEASTFDADCRGVEFGKNTFCFEITTTSANQTFYVPTSGGTNRSFNWDVNWGDGSADASKSGTTSSNLSHAFANAGSYIITLTPNQNQTSVSSKNGWLSAFGLSANNSGNANSAVNKSLLSKIISPIYPEMTRTADQVKGTSPAPEGEWQNAFFGANNLKMGNNFTFSKFAWTNISTVGANFAKAMFKNIAGNEFTMSPVFNLPRTTKNFGAGYAMEMFNGVTGASFNMNFVFRLPDTLGVIGADFANGLFSGVNSPLFQVNDTFKLNDLSTANLQKTGVYFKTLYLGSGVKPQKTGAATLLLAANHTPNDSDNRFTFGLANNGTWFDICDVPVRFGGRDFCSVITYHVNGGAIAPNSNWVGIQKFPIDANVIVNNNDKAISRSNFTFTKWNSAANGSGTVYIPGQNLGKNTGSKNLYAIWQRKPVPKPTVSPTQKPTPPSPSSIEVQADGDNEISVNWTGNKNDNVTMENALNDIDNFKSIISSITSEPKKSWIKKYSNLTTGSYRATVTTNGKKVTSNWIKNDLTFGKAFKFTDLGNNVPKERKVDIEWLSKAGVTFGVGCNASGGGSKCKYGPWNPVNRGAMAQFLHKLGGSPDSTQNTPKIKDISKLGSDFGSRGYDIRWLAAEGITVIFPNGNYYPNTPVNRGAMAQFMWKLAGSPEYDETDLDGIASAANLSKDKTLTELKKINSDRYYNILWLVKMNIAYTDPAYGKFNPSNPVNRGAMAQFMRKLYWVMMTGEKVPDSGIVPDKVK